MGREIRRVPKDFDWYQKTVKEKQSHPLTGSVPYMDADTWWGYLLPGVACQSCSGTGKTLSGEYCDICEGEGKAFPRIEVPQGDYYQLWETTSEGSPMSPPCETPEELARWLAENKATTFGTQHYATYEQWLAMIQKGSAPTFAAVGDRLMSGVEFVGRKP